MVDFRSSWPLALYIGSRKIIKIINLVAPIFRRTSLIDVNEGEIDLILTDVVMPEMDVREMVDQIKTICPKIKVLLMSGYTADIVAHRGIMEEGIQFVPNRSF